MTDLTKIEKPFMLLDSETQEALRECGGPWELLTIDGRWRELTHPSFDNGNVYRQKPQPREYEAWQVIFADGTHYGTPFPSRHVADGHAASIGGRVIRLTGRDE